MKKQLLLLLLPVILFTGCATTSVAVFDDSQTIEVIDSVHNSVHKGLASRFWTMASVPSGSSRYYHIDIAENDLHFSERDIVVAENDGEVNYKVYVDCDVSESGTLVDNIHNSNTNFDLVDDTAIYLDPTFSVCSSQTENVLIPAGFKSGSTSSDQFEWVYKANSSLIVEIENLGVKSIDINLRYKWYVD